MAAFILYIVTCMKFIYSLLTCFSAVYTYRVISVLARFADEPFILLVQGPQYLVHLPSHICPGEIRWRVVHSPGPAPSIPRTLTESYLSWRDSLTSRSFSWSSALNTSYTYRVISVLARFADKSFILLVQGSQYLAHLPSHICPGEIRWRVVHSPGPAPSIPHTLTESYLSWRDSLTSRSFSWSRALNTSYTYWVISVLARFADESFILLVQRPQYLVHLPSHICPGEIHWRVAHSPGPALSIPRTLTESYLSWRDSLTSRSFSWSSALNTSYTYRVISVLARFTDKSFILLVQGSQYLVHLPSHICPGEIRWQVVHSPGPAPSIPRTLTESYLSWRDSLTSRSFSWSRALNTSYTYWVISVLARFADESFILLVQGSQYLVHLPSHICPGEIRWRVVHSPGPAPSIPRTLTESYLSWRDSLTSRSFSWSSALNTSYTYRVISVLARFADKSFILLVQHPPSLYTYRVISVLARFADESFILLVQCPQYLTHLPSHICPGEIRWRVVHSPGPGLSIPRTLTESYLSWRDSLTSRSFSWSRALNTSYTYRVISVLARFTDESFILLVQGSQYLVHLPSHICPGEIRWRVVHSPGPGLSIPRTLTESYLSWRDSLTSRSFSWSRALNTSYTYRVISVLARFADESFILLVQRPQYLIHFIIL